MATIAQTIVVSPKVYRHFAVVTLVITGLIAIFADGERREEIASHIEARETQAKARRAEQEKQQAKALIHRQSNHGHIWGAGGEEAGSDAGDGVTQDAIASQPPGGASLRPSAAAAPGSVARLDEPRPDMPPDVYERLRRERMKRKASGWSDRPTQDQMQRFDETSAERSGGASGDE